MNYRNHAIELTPEGHYSINLPNGEWLGNVRGDVEAVHFFIDWSLG